MTLKIPSSSAPLLALARMLVLSVLLGWTQPALPQTTGGQAYIVEIIIFRAASVGAVAEDWSAAPMPRGFGSESARGNNGPQVLKLLGADQYKLAGIESQLRNSGAWRPLAHVAWTQTAANWGTHAGLSLSDLGINVPGLSGTAYFERGQYPHLGFDLAWGTNPAYRINEMRSVRYGDKQYFDHPAFGVIAVVAPVRTAASAQ